MAASFAAKTGVPLAAAASATAMYMYTARPMLHMEGDAKDAQKKLPIYSSTPETVYLAEVRGPLEDQVAGARRAFLHATHDARTAVQGQVSRWINVEKSVERKVSSLIPNDEALTPGILYVGIATLAGSVFTRYRALPLRLLTPPILLVGSLNYFLPHTAHNLSQYYLELEQQHLPNAVRTQREALVARWQDTQKAATEQYATARQGTGDLVQRGLKGVEQNTGLKVGGGSSSSSGQGSTGSSPNTRLV